MAAQAHATEYIRDALGNDIGIMAEPGTNEMTNGPKDWNQDPSGPIEGGPQGNYTSKQGAVPGRL